MPRSKVTQFILSIVVLPLCLGSIFYFYYRTIVNSEPVNYYDEVMWIGKSYFFDLFIHDKTNTLWDSVYSYDQPKLVEYMFGMSVYPSYLQEKKKDSGLTYFAFLSRNRLLCDACIDAEHLPADSVLTSYNDFLTNPPSKTETQFYSLVTSARTVNVFISIATIMLVYYFGMSLWGTISGLFLALFYGSNSLILRTTLLAHADALLLFFMIASLYFLFLYMKKSRIEFYFLSSACIGCMASVKIIGLILLLPFIFLTISAKNAGKQVQRFMGVLFIIASIFWLFNPYIRKNPFQRIQTMYTHRLYQEFWVGPNDASYFMPEPKNRIVSVYERFFVPTGPLYIAPFVASSYNGWGSWIYGILVIAGGVSFMKKRFLFIPLTTYFIWITMAYWLIVGWDRYYAPLVFLFLCMMVEGMRTIVSLLLPYRLRHIIFPKIQHMPNQ